MREPESIGMLREFIRQAGAGAVDRDLVGWMAARWQDYMKHAHLGVTIGGAFGLEVDTSSRGWWMASRRAKWEAAIRDLAADHYAGLSPREQAARAAQRLARYLAGSRWRRDRRAGRPAPGASTLEAALFRVAMHADGFGLSARTLQRVLETEEGGQAADAQ